MGLSLSATSQTATVVRDDYSRLQLHITTEAPRLGEAVVDGRTFTTLEIEGFLPSSEVGAPCLPTFTGLIEVPLCEDYEVEISNAVYDTLEPVVYQLLPAQPSRSKSDSSRHPLMLDAKRYATDAFAGGGVRVTTAGIARDRRLAHLEYCPVQYNPVSGTLVVCRSATVTVRYRKVDIAATEELFQRYHSPAFASGAMSINSLYPKSVTNELPIRYLIVANGMFRNQLDTFIQWKRRKGFITDIVYTDDPGMSCDTSSIASYLRSQYTGANTSLPAPTYLLLVGDVDQLPPFEGTTDNDHVTDLYYTTWTAGDHLPDCYYGRFSAQSISQLTPQIEKTLMYEQYTFADPSFLDRAVMVAGVDGGSSGDHGYTHADPTMDYAIVNYINGSRGFSEVRYFKNNTSVVPVGATNVYVDGNSSSMSATVRSYYNQGAGLINYSAHGSATSWGTPSLTTSHVDAMTNTQKFGLMIGNCCLTNKFETSTCLGEALLRKNNYCGAVGYIGGSNSTYWNEDLYWAVGVRSGISATMSLAYNNSHLGVYDRTCHTHGETFSQWATSQGSIMMWGNMAVESSTSGLTHYYWEIYHLMGDPSVMPYLTQADIINVSATACLPYTTTDYTVSVVPYAYVALTDTLTHSVVAATYADANGDATLTLPPTLPAGGYELAVSAQQYRTAFFAVSIIPPGGPFPTLVGAEPQGPLNAGSSQNVILRVANLGDSTAHNITLTLTSSDTAALLFAPQTLVIDSLQAGDTMVLTASAIVSPLAIDEAQVMLKGSAVWSDSPYNSLRSVGVTLYAPLLVANLSNVPRNLQPGETVSFTLPVSNIGHCAQSTGRLHLDSPTFLLNTGNSSVPFSLNPSSSVSHTFTVHSDSLLPDGIDIPVTLYMGEREVANLAFYIGAAPYETFENNSFHVNGWIQGTYPWQFSTDKAHQGTYSLRSSNGLSHNQTAEISLVINLLEADSISFYYSVSSETNYDKFHFLIDDNELVTSSGIVDWTRFAALVPAGTHTINFTYSKDYSVSSNSDCAWIDEIQLPHFGQVVTYLHDDLCEGAPYTLGGETINTQIPGSGSRVLEGADGALTLADYVIHPVSDTLVEAVACDSYTFLGNDYSTSDSLVFTLTNLQGCDSIVTLLLTVNHSVNTTLTDTIEGTIYQWNGITYTQSGQYEQNFFTTEGCDSTVTLLLTLVDPNHEGITETATLTIDAHPNPTIGMVRLSERALRVDIYDAQGRLVGRFRDTDTLDFGSLPAGTYTLLLTLPSGTTTCRVVRR